ncbi:MAG: phosphoribosylformylglycinamidine cyclo-ligase [Anaerolineae bacterium]|nr:phosphoribosylformylglycinamidine cyclo-ligase [Anaerolineae bacterium]
MNKSAYARAGVDIAAGQQATELMKESVRTTYGPEVLAGLGAFGGLYDVGKLKTMHAPVLVASTDGVGTKTKVASQLGQWGTVGQDIVNHCINDILVQGARPLFFLDYVASAQLNPEEIAMIVHGITIACREAGCALLGGETAEMPGVYQPGEFDLVGTIVGVVERDEIIDSSKIEPGDVILGLPSTGLHTNGYSLARQVLNDFDWKMPHPGLGCSIGEALLAVHRSYLPPVQKLREARIDIRGLAHITGGGIIDNLPRILPANLGAIIQRGIWPELPIFDLIQRQGNIPPEEMFHVFNMGLGMLVVVSPDQVSSAQTILPDEVYVVGEIVGGGTGVAIT